MKGVFLLMLGSCSPFYSLQLLLKMIELLENAVCSRLEPRKVSLKNSRR